MNIFPNTEAPPLPEHAKLEEQDSIFIERAQDFLQWLRWQKEIQLRSDLEQLGQGSPMPEALELLLEYLGLDYAAYQAEKTALQDWLRQSPKQKIPETKA